MDEVSAKDSLTWMSLLVDNEVWEPREQTNKVDLIVMEQVEVKNQVLKTIIVMVVVEAYLQWVSPLWGETPKQVSEVPSMVEEESWIVLTHYPWEEEVKPLIQCWVPPIPHKFLEVAKFCLHHWNPPPNGILERGCALGLTMGSPSFPIVPGTGQSQIPEPVSSTVLKTGIFPIERH